MPTPDPTVILGLVDEQEPRGGPRASVRARILVIVLDYGDAAVFDTAARGAMPANLDRNDPYFRASEVGITAVAGLAGEDLADDFTAVLTGPPDETHRLLTVFEALTSGPPNAVRSPSSARARTRCSATRMAAAPGS